MELYGPTMHSDSAKGPEEKKTPRQKNLLEKLVKKLGKQELVLLLLLVVGISVFSGLVAGAVFGGALYQQASFLLKQADLKVPDRVVKETVVEKEYIPQTTQEQKIIDAVKEVSPAVVSIVITKDVPVLSQFQSGPFSVQVRQEGTERQEVGGGSGFVVSKDGMIVTNKHVVLDETADYTVFTTSGASFPARVLAKDPLQDLAILKIDQESVIDGDGNFEIKPFPFVRLGDSNILQIGQTVITIGNALAEFRNTVSVGVISGLGRTITASGGDFVETIEDVIQTDAAINKGNSGGPLLNLAGEVVGINTATVLDAQSIGFAIPIDRAKRDLEQVKELGKIVYPFLGVEYRLVNEALQLQEDLAVDYGALVREVAAGSAAKEAGILAGDILLEFDGERVTEVNSLAKIIQRYDEDAAKAVFNPGDEVVLKVLRQGEEKILTATLGERSE